MEILVDYGWSTHQPLLKVLLNMFKPLFILELGSGIFSTPLFIAYGSDKFLCVENDENWFNHIKKEYGNDCNIILHKLEKGINAYTSLSQLTLTQTNAISHYYENIVKDVLAYPKMLFVDNFRCCRTIAINTLYKNFDIVVYHDCEPAGVSFYEYNFVDDLRANFNSYILKTPKSWTGCFVRSGLNDADLEEEIKPFLWQYCNENNIEHVKIYLEALNK